MVRFAQYTLQLEGVTWTVFGQQDWRIAELLPAEPSIQTPWSFAKSEVTGKEKSFVSGEAMVHAAEVVAVDTEDDMGKARGRACFLRLQTD